MTQRIAAAVLLLVLALPCGAMATSVNGNVMMRYWVASDRCAASAQKQFPDFTAESNAKRDNALKQCLANGNLPPREELNH